MNVREYLPTPPAMASEAIAVLVGTVVAAYVISKFPQLKRFVVENSVSLTDGTLTQGGPFLEN